jgi:glyoxylase-like metal-dependent hydrolase (beta-lactamase superfamily II)
MKAFNTTIPASPHVALPVITFTRDVTFHLNGDELHLFHVKNAHTDGDAVVHFRKANVLHTGDLYFAGIYPFIDIQSGGSINGMVAAGKHLLPLIDDNSTVIPGHGPKSNKAEYKAFLEMLTSIRDRVNKLIKEGKSQEEAVAAKPTADFDGKWGKGFLSPDQFVSIVYSDLSQP